MSNLKEKSIGSAKWTLFFLLAQYFITFFLSIVLSRLISPKEFGLTGMLSIIISIATVITNSGLSSALVFDKKSTDDDYTTVFYFNFIVSCILYFILFFSAPLIADFYNQPALISLTRWLSLVFVFNALSIIQSTILVIRLDFKKQSLIKISALLVSVLISIILAFSGWGVFSIVAQSLIQAALTSILFWYYSEWRPKGKFTRYSFFKLWDYGSKILYSNLFTSFVQNVDNMIVGKLFSPLILGLFVRAKSTKAIPENIFTQAFQTSIFPILSKLNEDRVEHRNKHLQFFKIGSYFIFPLVLVFFFSTPELIRFLYGENWIGAIPYLQIISFSIIPYFLGILFNQTLLSLGDSKLFMKLNMFRRVLGLINIPVAIFWGLVPYLYSIVIFNTIGLFIDILYSAPKIGTSFKDYLPTIIKSLFYSLMMIVIIVSIQYLPFNLMLLKFIGIFISIIFYFVLMYFFERQILGYYVEIFKSFTNRR